MNTGPDGACRPITRWLRRIMPSGAHGLPRTSVWVADASQSLRRRSGRDARMRPASRYDRDGPFLRDRRGSFQHGMTDDHAHAVVQTAKFLMAHGLLKEKQ